MKKTFASLLGVVLLLGLLLSLWGCRAKENIVGTWEGTLDFSKAFSQGVTEGDEEAGQYFNITGMNLTVRMTFRKNGTYTVSVDEKSAKAAFRDIESQLAAGMRAYIGSLLEGTGMSVDDALAQSGTTVEEMIGVFCDEEAVAAMISLLKREAKYKVENGKLFSSDGPDDEIDESKFQPYSVSGNELRLLESKDTKDDPFAGMYPLILKKAK